MLQHPLKKQMTSLRTYKNQIFLGSQVARFSRDPSCSSTGSYVICFQGNHLQRQYHQRTTYTHETLIVAQRYDVPRDWLWDACHQAGVRWVSRCEGFCSEEGPHYCFLQSAMNLTINLDLWHGNPLWILFPNCTAKLSRAYVTRESVSSRIFVSKKGMICICPMDVCFRNLWQKAESVLLQETNVFCAWNMGVHVWCTTS